jgi:hypothetical protein
MKKSQYKKNQNYLLEKSRSNLGHMKMTKSTIEKKRKGRKDKDSKGKKNFNKGMLKYGQKSHQKQQKNHFNKPSHRNKKH